MDKAILTTICLLIFLIIFCLVLGNIAHCTPIYVKDKATVDMPYYFSNNSARWGEITDYAVCENVLYVLFEGKGILDCYSLDGTYLHSYSIALGEKGKAELYVKGNDLYLKARNLRFFTFQSGIFVDTYSVSANELYSEIQTLSEPSRSAQSMEYIIRAASIWRVKDELSEEIVHRPQWMTVFQGGILMAVGPICLVCLWIILYYKKRLS